MATILKSKDVNALPDNPSERFSQIVDKLLEIAEHLCTQRNLCSAVYDFLWDPTAKLPIGPRPTREHHEFEVTVDVGAGPVTKTVSYRSYSLEGAKRAWASASGFGGGEDGKMPEALPAFEGELPKDAADLLAGIRKVCDRGLRDGRIHKSLLNEFIPLLGMEEYPAKKRFEFLLELAPADVEPPTHVRYTGVGLTAEEAIKDAQKGFERDQNYLANGGYREYHKPIDRFQWDPRYRKTAENATLVLDPEHKPEAAE